MEGRGEWNVDFEIFVKKIEINFSSNNASTFWHILISSVASIDDFFMDKQWFNNHNQNVFYWMILANSSRYVTASFHSFTDINNKLIFSLDEMMMIAEDYKVFQCSSASVKSMSWQNSQKCLLHDLTLREFQNLFCNQFKQSKIIFQRCQKCPCSEIKFNF